MLTDKNDHRYFRNSGHPGIADQSISDEQRLEFGNLVGATIGQIEAAQFPSHSGIRFPQNGCVSCSHLGLCLDDQKLIESNLTLRPGATDLAWLDELVD